MSGDKKRGGYEPIPDAEEAPGPSAASRDAARAKYPGFGDREVDLLATLDDAVENQPGFEFPALDPDDLASQGRGFVRGMLQPTVTVVGTTAASLLLSATSQSQSAVAAVSQFLIPWFPYINAVVVFGGSFVPLSTRLMDSVDPVFAKMEDTQQQAERRVDSLGDQVDGIVDRIQAQVAEVLAPYKPLFAQATAQEKALQKIRPGLDIPDPSDIE